MRRAGWVLVLLLLALTGCSIRREESWVGKNTGVTIDSSADPPGAR